MRDRAGAVVIGVGNVFRRDDGVGWALIETLRGRSAGIRLPKETVLRESAGDPGQLIALWEDAVRAVVVDACFPSAALPGRVHRWCPSPGEVPPPEAGRHSTHGLGVAHALRLADALGRRPADLVVYAVEGADRSLGTGLSPAVADAVQPLAERIARDLTSRTGGRQGP
ncbi:hydrogenase maturation protease [Actinacidiphila glaucinigra]|uniref:hydrogenase maturation protease n=1 Tax=Actinacidiphila glaucinigra TaxID=235986 RepID=UPI0036E0EC21